ncbi:MAG: c-type cytochrome [Gemmatimonadaceae bacterium]|nr:c-type cytochrome [Gemmatimonadaceae bacterium]
MTHTLRNQITVGVLTVALVAGLSIAAAAAAQGPSVTPQGAEKALITQGENIFKGKAAGGLCWTCHGLNAKGVKGLGPDLTDKTWLHGDGSVTFVKSTVKAGISKPKQGSLPMPPFGGVPLNDSQLAAVAAYVASLSAGK